MGSGDTKWPRRLRQKYKYYGGDRHPDMIRSRADLTAIYHTLRRYEEAKKIYAQGVSNIDSYVLLCKE
jgi:hypothetical protein